MDLRLTFAISIGKAISIFNKISGTGGTAAPGLFALKIDPNLVRKLTKKLPFGNLVISGTNGKTTTTRLTSNILETKFKIVNNRQGSNLLRGIASTLITRSDLVGNLDANLGIWEVDEGTLPEVAQNTNPKLICLLNLFRDQLDRYGEVDTTRQKWQKSLTEQNQGPTLILNADDPQIAFIGEKLKKTMYFGINQTEFNLPQIPQVADIKYCLNCASKLNYKAQLTSHMGHYFCTKCKFKRPIPQISASKTTFKSNFSTSTTINKTNINYNLPGLYNVYNVLAAFAICDALKIDHTKIKEKIEEFSAVFGRFQKSTINNKKIITFLIKNPAGANEVIRTLSLKKDLNILAILNDNIADGKDVSWIWDTNWEKLIGQIKNISVSGTRSYDLAVRLKYAGIDMKKVKIDSDISNATKEIIHNAHKNELIFLPTYTALLDVQKTLAKLGGAKWHKD